ncbi:hypothetical protein BDD12DRAFT_316285 [Trichophaea hybrida]|nr:hypothetical protein BDD12DRAFT_316285 [Trichophaea hybrida]
MIVKNVSLRCWFGLVWAAVAAASLLCYLKSLLSGGALCTCTSVLCVMVTGQFPSPSGSIPHFGFLSEKVLGNGYRVPKYSCPLVRASHAFINLTDQPFA